MFNQVNLLALEEREGRDRVFYSSHNCDKGLEMFTKIFAAGSASFVAAAVLISSPAQAYDPCQRAFERVEQLEAEMRAYHRACNYPACLYTVGFNRLVAELNAAREQRRRACNP